LFAVESATGEEGGAVGNKYTKVVALLAVTTRIELRRHDSKRKKKQRRPTTQPPRAFFSSPAPGECHCNNNSSKTIMTTTMTINRADLRPSINIMTLGDGTTNAIERNEAILVFCTSHHGVVVLFPSLDNHSGRGQIVIDFNVRVTPTIWWYFFAPSAAPPRSTRPYGAGPIAARSSSSKLYHHDCGQSRR
jgi:hypothetical protein